MTGSDPDAGRGTRLRDIQDFLSSVWREVFPESTGSMDEDFFALAGSSVDAAMIAARLSVYSGVRISAGEIFFHSTPQELALAAWRAMEVT
ncbi:phosphopantetheine-binding protein [Kitasatospora kifunensis]|nr:phosphopantetheine-binding protein [Kitasatospora kifunensis]